MSPELRALISEAQSLVSMLRSDLDDLANDRQPPDGDNGLLTAQRRSRAINASLGEIEDFAKRRGLSLRPRVKFDPPPLPPRHERLF